MGLKINHNTHKRIGASLPAVFGVSYSYSSVELNVGKRTLVLSSSVESRQIDGDDAVSVNESTVVTVLFRSRMFLSCRDLGYPTSSPPLSSISPFFYKIFFFSKILLKPLIFHRFTKFHSEFHFEKTN